MQPATPPVQHPMSSRRLRILLVEDHPDYQQLLAAALTSAGHAVTPANSRRSALAQADNATFDLVISDYRLQDGTGTDLMKAIKSAHGLTGICLSGYEEDELHLLAGGDAGFERYLLKGVAFEAILSTIDELMTSANISSTAMRSDTPR